MKNEVLIIGGIAVAIGAFFLLSNKEEEPVVLIPQPQPSSGNNQGNNPLPNNGFNLPNKNLLLQKGSKGIEVYELQQLLKISSDGAFGSQTENALFNKKGVKKITLNDYSKIKDVVGTPLKIGDVVKPNPLMGIMGTKVYQNITTNGNYTNTKKHIDTYFTNELIGKIVSITPNKEYSVILGNHPLTGKDEILWVLSSEIVKA